jgi:hypothetical protein
LTIAQAKTDIDRDHKVDQLGGLLFGDIYVPRKNDFDPAELTMENLDALLREEREGDDLSRGVVITGDWKIKDWRVTRHDNFFASWLAEDGSNVLHKQLQGGPEDAGFILEDLARGCVGGEIRFRPAANDNTAPAPAISTTSANTKPKLTPDQEREALETFQREQLLPGGRGELVYDDAAFRALSSGPFWHIRNAIVEGFAGDVFISVLDGAPKLHADSIVEPITPRAPFPLVDPSEWHGTIAKVREWFLSGLIPHRQVTLLTGDGGMGKSLLGLQIGAASALAIKTLGLEPRPGRVLYLGAEDEADEFQRRLDDI